MLSKWLFLIPSLFLIALTAPLGARAQEQIISGYDGHAGFQGPVWAAKDLGLFDKHGLSAELVLFPGSARGMAALISCGVRFVQGSPTHTLSAYFPGAVV